MNEELNKKLAEWAGFVFDEGAEYGIPPIFGLWYTPDNNHIGYPELPSFTQSLDACFKWLVPKMRKEYSDEHFGETLREWLVTLLYFGDLDKGELTPALALCLAIEKLIDEEH